MFESIKSWFQGAEQPTNENKWDANTVTMQQPNSPAAPSMNQTITQQPGTESAAVQMRGGGDFCCGVCAGLCCFECCECCC